MGQRNCKGKWARTTGGCGECVELTVKESEWGTVKENIWEIEIMMNVSD